MARAESLSVAELEQMLESRRAELGKLMDQRDRLAAELAECDARINELSGGSTGGRRRRVARRRKPGRSRIRNQPALKTVITEVLQKSKKPMSLDDIIEKVLATGYKSTSENFRQVAYLNLFNMKKNGEVEHDPATKLYRAASA
ncbi:MAG TPA: hypothetical protein VF170_08245 [Planctomycetaceae bacterium]